MRNKDKLKLKKIVKLVLGWLLIIAGIIFMFLPFFQGTVTILLGIGILSSEYKWARNFFHKVQLIYQKLKFKIKFLRPPS